MPPTSSSQPSATTSAASWRGSGSFGASSSPTSSQLPTTGHCSIRLLNGRLFTLHHLGIDYTEPRDLLVQFRDFVLEPRNLCLWHRITAAVGGLQLRYVARDALLNPLQTPFHLGFGE